jgi:isoleucyl-tRNA synthetase
VFTSEAGPYAGQQIPAVNKVINRDLAESGILIHQSEINHSYPHCWRCKKPVMYRATPQWFISMENNDLRARSLDNIKKVEWTPAWGMQRIYAMIEGRPDWCLSRQRSWGVPITIISCSSCGEIVKSESLVRKINELFLKEGADAWFRHGIEVFLEPGTKCGSCGSTEFTKEGDILDVWFDSGVSHAAVCEERPELRSPADLYLEGSDQHRGWFHSALLTSVGTRDRAPFLGVLTHGYVVDGQGKKMSKSVGNVVAPGEVIEKYGAEILRLWVSSEDYRDDVKVSDEILRQVSDSYRKIRNTIRYMLGNLSDFNPNLHRVNRAELPELDRWALARYDELKAKVVHSYDKFEFHAIYQSLNYFCGTTLSAFYLDIIKDRLYASGTDSFPRRAAQSALFEMLDGILRLMMPVLSFTATEAWESLYGLTEASPLSESIFFAEFPPLSAEEVDHTVEIRWSRLIRIRSEITKALEIARQEKIIGHPLEAEVRLQADGELADFLAQEWHTIKEIAIVSVLEKEDGGTETGVTFASEEVEALVVRVLPAPGQKCERCWIRSTTVGLSSEHLQLCDRCAAVVSHIDLRQGA